MTTANKDQTRFIQKQFSDQVELSKKELSSCRLKKKFFWSWVVIAKLIILGAGIALGTGLSEPVSKCLGIVMASITALEVILRGHSRLILLEELDATLEKLINSISERHTSRMPEVLKYKETEPAKAMSILNDLNNDLRLELASSTQKVCATYKKKSKMLLKSLAISKSIS